MRQNEKADHKNEPGKYHGLLTPRLTLMYSNRDSISLWQSVSRIRETGLKI
jgi:hypothetical protein